MLYVQTANGVQLTLEKKPLGKGGEATVHRIMNAPPQYKNCCIKIYNNPKLEIKEKIAFIIKNPISVPPNLVNLLKICAPKELVFDSKNRSFFKGYIMPLAFDGSYTLQKLLTRPKTISWHKEYDLTIANGFRRNLGLCQNIALITYLVHEAGLTLNKQGGYVLVDMKPENIMVTKDAKVSLIDFDSIQINVNPQKVFHASVRSPEYASPEVLRHNNQQPLHYSSDNFTLAVILYKIMCGLNPYAGSLKGAGGTETAQAILGGFYPHGKRRSSFVTIPRQHERVGLLSQKIRQAFEQALSESVDFPAKRASAKDWGMMFSEEQTHNDYANNRKVMPKIGIVSTVNTVKVSVNPSKLFWGSFS